MTQFEPVGLIGLGRMGGGMCRSLIRDGREVVAWDLVAAACDAARAEGARIAADPAGLAAAVQVVILSLPDAHAVHDVLVGGRGILAAGSKIEVIVDTSTTFPSEARELAATAAAAGVAFLDAPVSGGVGGAETGSLSVMVGGKEADLDRVMPLIEPIGRTFTYCGPTGAGQVAKACNQLIVMSTVEAVAETLVLAQAAGLDPRRIRDALMSGFAASPILEGQGLRMIERDFVPGGRSLFHLKDIATIREIASHSDLALPGFEESAANFERLVNGGGGDLDHSAVVTVVEREPLGSLTGHASIGIDEGP